MALAANDYGTVAQVAALTRRFTKAGAYDETTNPTLGQIELMMDRVSALLNVLLAEQGFKIPLTQSDCVQALGQFVVAQVSDLCNYANSAGRFFDNKSLKTGPFSAIMAEAEEFISNHADGFEKLGATRTYSSVEGLATTTLSDSGDTLEPIFSLKQFGNKNPDWDPAST